ncbi:MAG: plasmid mobilization relaxosome protein MobC [Bdellovibrionaceae bacterium]|nr:plasmid mobilization relaxosome protein MobC [Pseudobdellovibrionaceae bacterium]
MEQLNLETESDVGTALCVRIDATEHHRIKKMIAATGMSGPELFRRALFARMDLERPLLTPEQAKSFETELKRQGNNINQIAKKINMGLMAGWSQALSAINVNYMKLSQMLTVNYANR